MPPHDHDHEPTDAGHAGDAAPGYYEIMETSIRELLVEKHLIAPARSAAIAEPLLSRETLNEQEILAVTGLPPAPALDTGLLPVSGAGAGR